jgi:hypothetical protein
MKPLKDLCNLIEESKFTLIGYTFRDERIKDELISNFNYVEIKEINSSFSFKSFLRELKLNQVLDDQKNFEYILLDLNNILPETESYNISKYNRLRNILQKLRERIWVEGETQYKIIVTSPVYRNVKEIATDNFTGGNQAIYMSELAMVINGEKVKVIKNRNGENRDYILYNTKQNVEF